MQRFCLAVLMVLSLFAVQAHAEKLIIAQPFDALIWAPIYVARDKGYFADEGLEVEIALVKGGPASVTAVLTGSAQLGLGNPGATMLARSQGQKAKVVALLCDQIANSILVRTSALQERGITASTPVDDRLKALKGLTFAVNGSGSVADMILRHALKHVGLDPDSDATIMPIDSHAAAVAAFEQGRIDGFVQGPPASEMITADGQATVVVDLIKGEYAPLANLAYVTLTADEAWLAENPETARKAVHAVGRALKLIHENSAEAKASVRKFFPDISQEIFDMSWERVTPAYTLSTKIDPASLAKNAEFSAAAGGKPYDLNIEDVYTNDFTE